MSRDHSLYNYRIVDGGSTPWVLWVAKCPPGSFQISFPPTPIHMESRVRPVLACIQFIVWREQTTNVKKIWPNWKDTLSQPSYSILRIQKKIQWNESVQIHPIKNENPKEWIDLVKKRLSTQIKNVLMRFKWIKLHFLVWVLDNFWIGPIHFEQFPVWSGCSQYFLGPPTTFKEIVHRDEWIKKNISKF